MTFLPTEYGFGRLGGIGPDFGGQQQQGGLLNFLQNPAVMNMAASLLESSGPSPVPISTGQVIGRGLMAYQQGLDNAYKQRILGLHAKKAEQDMENERRINDFYANTGKYYKTAQQQAMANSGGGPTVEAAAADTSQYQPYFDQGAMYRDMLSVPGLARTAAEHLVPKTTIQDGYAITVGPDGNVAARQIEGYDRPPKSELDLYMKDQAAFSRYAEMKNRGSGGWTPYSIPIYTSEGVMSFDTRTKDVSPVVVGGRPITGAQYDPILQGRLAGAKESGKTIGEQSAKTAMDLPRDVAEAERTVGLVDDLLAHPGFGAAVGKSSMLGTQFIPGTDAKDFMVRLDQLKGKQFLQAYQTLKGGGQITEVEGIKATNAISRMNNAASEQEFVRAAREFQGAVRSGVEKLKIRAQSVPGGVGQQTGGVRRYNPATGRIE